MNSPAIVEIDQLKVDKSDLEIAALLRAIPGIHTLSALIAIDPVTLSYSARIDYLSALERQSAWLQAAMQRAIVAVAGDEPTIATGIFAGVDDAEREDVSTALRMSGGSAQIRIDVARTLVNHLPNTCSALATGEISPAHATVIARETASAIRNGLGAAAIYVIEEKALAHAEFHTPAQVANKVRTVLAQIAPATFEEVVERARDTRRVSCYKENDGMSTVIAILPAEDAQTVMKAIEAFILKANDADASMYASANASANASADGKGLTFNKSSQAKGVNDNRSADMKRADALTAIASAALAQLVDEVRPHRRPITVNVTIDLPTLLGLAENPGQLAGYGAIPASVARTLASDGKWRRFVTDPQTGALLDYGRNIYEPPQALIDFLIARDRTCRFPGCRAPATLGDIDHAQSWESGGKTNLENLGALCRRHHQLKTHSGWKLVSNSDGSCQWTSPTGKVFEVPARPILETV